MKRILAAVLSITLPLLTLGAYGKNTGRDLKAHADWLLSMQTEEGAVLLYETAGAGRYNPYFACYAMIGLLEYQLREKAAAGEKYRAAARAYMEFHLSRLNVLDKNGVSGTIYDYETDPATGRVRSCEDYDSTDSYAAVMLMLVDKYAAVTDDGAFLAAKKGDVERIAGAMLSTLDGGLTFARPDYRVKYLMDNCEVYGGLTAASRIFADIYKDKVLAERYRKEAEELRAKIERDFWDAKQGVYHCAILESGPAELDQSRFYPDGASQLYPIIFGVLSPESKRAEELYSRFHTVHSGWTSLRCDSHPWGVILLAAQKMGDADRMDAYFAEAEAYLAENGHGYPWNCAESGFLLWAAGRVTTWR